MKDQPGRNPGQTESPPLLGGRRIGGEWIAIEAFGLGKEILVEPLWLDAHRQPGGVSNGWLVDAGLWQGIVAFDLPFSEQGWGAAYSRTRPSVASGFARVMRGSSTPAAGVGLGLRGLLRPCLTDQAGERTSIVHGDDPARVEAGNAAWILTAQGRSVVPARGPCSAAGAGEGQVRGGKREGPAGPSEFAIQQWPDRRQPASSTA